MYENVHREDKVYRRDINPEVWLVFLQEILIN